MEFIINPEYEALVPKLSKDQIDLLSKSIKENGQQESIIINDQGVILDGHHRFKVCRSLGIECSIIEKNFSNLLEEKLYVIDANRARRQLNPVQLVYLNSKRKKILSELARLNMSKAGQGVQICTPLGRVNTIITERFGSLNSSSR